MQGLRPVLVDAGGVQLSYDALRAADREETRSRLHRGSALIADSYARQMQTKLDLITNPHHITTLTLPRMSRLAQRYRCTHQDSRSDQKHVLILDPQFVTH